MLENISDYLGISKQAIIILGLVYYFLPLIIQAFYGEIKIGFLLVCIFLGWTPLPWIILVLNFIEDNSSIDLILNNQEEIIKKLEKFKL